MSRTQQKIILLQEPSIDAFDISLQAGNMCLNRFCIDEEAGFELAGIYLLKDTSRMMRHKDAWLNSREPSEQQRELGKNLQYLRAI